ncbi:hypothetical protein, partial [Streptomyces nigrescens]|uniref:hypothetical protein n=1 Tax=Streptomyces nigrescens TaxID=1920 RepID=UPI00347AB354
APWCPGGGRPERSRRAARPEPPGRAGRRHRRTTRPWTVVRLPPGQLRLEAALRGVRRIVRING